MHVLDLSVCMYTHMPLMLVLLSGHDESSLLSSVILLACFNLEDFDVSCTFHESCHDDAASSRQQQALSLYARCIMCRA